MSEPDLATMRRMFGGADRGGRDSFVVPGPGHGNADRSLSVTFNADGTFVCHSFAGDDFRACRDYVAARLGIAAPRPTVRPRLDAMLHSEDRSDRVAYARRLWAVSVPLVGTIAERYLRSRLHGEAVPAPIHQADALRWHGGISALVAAMTDPTSGDFTGVHRTFLDAGGRKVARKMLGRKGVVRLWPDDAVTLGLAVGEGIETTIAATIITGYAPAWAALDAGNIAAFPVLAGIENLTIFADHDPNGVGQRAARSAAERWAESGCEARILTPVDRGSDFNDLQAEVA
jgi:hypothetical protein